METFTFIIDLPAAPGLPDLFARLAEQMSQYIGLAEVEAAQAGAVLTRLVADRLSRTGEHVRVTFERPHGAGTVHVEIAGRALPEDVPDVSAGGGVIVETDGHTSRLRLSWTPRNNG